MSILDDMVRFGFVLNPIRILKSAKAVDGRDHHGTNAFFGTLMIADREVTNCVLRFGNALCKGGYDICLKTPQCTYGEFGDDKFNVVNVGVLSSTSLVIQTSRGPSPRLAWYRFNIIK
jgi:hypothetical protein